MNILLIEDDADCVDLLNHRLRGPRVTVAGSLSEAKRVLAAVLMDLVVLDLSLPDSPTAATIEEIGLIKQMASGARLVIMTGNNNPAHWLSAYRNGADKVLAKDDGYRIVSNEIMKFGEPCLGEEQIKALEQLVRAVAEEPIAVSPSKELAEALRRAATLLSAPVRQEA